MIKLFKSIYHDVKAISNSIEESLNSGWTIAGPKVKKLEKLLEEYIGVKHVIMTNCCSSALHLAVLNRFRKDDIVISTPNTFVITNMVPLYNNNKLVFVDIDNNGNINVDKVEKQIGRYGHSISGMIIVHFSGTVVDIEKVNFLSEKYNIPVIEDCAHCFGAKYHDGVIVGNSRNICCFSFHAMKPLPVNRGGFITTNDDKIAERIRDQSWFGIRGNTFERSSQKRYKWDYDVRELGFNYEGNDLLAAIAIEQLPYLDQDVETRLSLAQFYYDNLSKIENIRIEPPVKGSSYYFQPVFVKRRNEFVEKMSEAGIECGMHYKMNYNYKVIRDSLVNSNEKFEKGDEYDSTELTLPFGVHLTEFDQKYIVVSVEKINKELNGEK